MGGEVLFGVYRGAQATKTIMTGEVTSGVSWYRREDYQTILDVIEDAGLPGTYDEWLKDAESEERESQGMGRYRRARHDRPEGT